MKRTRNGSGNGPGLTRRELAAAGLGIATAVTITPPAAAAGPGGSLSALPLEDRLAIEDLFTRYMWSYDCTDEDEFLDLFSDDALIIGKGTRYQGKEAILGWFRYLIGLREHDGDDIWIHEASQFRFMPSGNTCLVYAYATHFNGNTARATRGVRSLGYFVCECVRKAGEWKFRRFGIMAWDRTMLPWKKPLPWADGDKS